MIMVSPVNTGREGTLLVGLSVFSTIILTVDLISLPSGLLVPSFSRYSMYFHSADMSWPAIRTSLIRLMRIRLQSKSVPSMVSIRRILPDNAINPRISRTPDRIVTTHVLRTLVFITGGVNFSRKTGTIQIAIRRLRRSEERRVGQ